MDRKPLTPRYDHVSQRLVANCTGRNQPGLLAPVSPASGARLSCADGRLCFESLEALDRARPHGPASHVPHGHDAVPRRADRRIVRRGRRFCRHPWRVHLESSRRRRSVGLDARGRRDAAEPARQLRVPPRSRRTTRGAELRFGHAPQPGPRLARIRLRVPAVAGMGRVGSDVREPARSRRAETLVRMGRGRSISRTGSRPASKSTSTRRGVPATGRTS